MEKDTKVLKLVENGTNRQGADFANAAQAFNAIYNQGKQGKAFAAVRFGELLSPEQRQYAYVSERACGRADVEGKE